MYTYKRYSVYTYLDTYKIEFNQRNCSWSAATAAAAAGVCVCVRALCVPMYLCSILFCFVFTVFYYSKTVSRANGALIFVLFLFFFYSFFILFI